MHQRILRTINCRSYTANLELSTGDDLNKRKLNSSDVTKPAVAEGYRADLPAEGRKTISVNEKQLLSTKKDKQIFSDVNEASDYLSVSRHAKFEAD